MKVKFLDDGQFYAHYNSQLKYAIDDDCGIGLPDVESFLPLTLPAIFSLELTPACNNRCDSCSNIFIKNKSLRTITVNNPMHSPADKWIHLLKQISPHTVTIRLTGGEPTFYPHFYEIIDTLNSLEIQFTIFTQGRWHDSFKLISYINNSPKCKGLLISLHGANAESHESFTGIRGSFSETTENIMLATSSGIRVNTNTVLTQYNIHQTKEIVKLSRHLGAEYSVFNRHIGPSDSSNGISISQLRQGISELEKMKQSGAQVKFGTCIPLCFENTSATGCLAGTAYCTIDPWGNVKPCNHSPLITGNIFEQCLTEIWMSKNMQTWRNLSVTECQSCELYNSCHGGCRAESLLNGVSKDPLMRKMISNSLAV